MDQYACLLMGVRFDGIALNDAHVVLSFCNLYKLDTVQQPILFQLGSPHQDIIMYMKSMQPHPMFYLRAVICAMLAFLPYLTGVPQFGRFDKQPCNLAGFRCSTAS